MSNDVYKKFKNMIESSEYKNEEELEEHIHNFLIDEMLQNNNVENANLIKAYKLVDKATQEKDEEKAIKYAKEAYELCPECIEALMVLENYEESAFKKLEMLDEILAFEKKRLQKINKYYKTNEDAYEEKEMYIISLFQKISLLIYLGRINIAKETCEEYLKIDSEDSFGVHTTLMAIYAYFEDEKNLLKLYKKYPEENLETIFPLFVLYFKQGNDLQATKYFNILNEINNNFSKYFLDTLDLDENEPNEEEIEILLFMEAYSFLVESTGGIRLFVEEKTKK